ncbi:MAG: hypothetical protein JW715_05580, partial [Sedimentisphaerales bacterium]|nr:hypothetical protein [Sedimentisphaerales bacterium]
SIIERLPVMENKEKIDILIDKNAAEQLSGVDWEKLNAAISGRLDKTRQKTPLLRKFPTLLKAAATIAAAATVIIAVTIYIEKPPRKGLDNDGRRETRRQAEVEFVKSKGSTSVEIQPASAGSLVTVDIAAEGVLAECNVEILEKNGGFEENTAGPTWIIISRPQSLYAENGTNRDMMDIMYLF